MLFAATLLKLEPIIVTTVPTGPEVGKKELILGGGININPDKVPEPASEVSKISPEEPEPTTAVMVVDETILNDEAFVPPNLTDVTPLKSDPVIVTVVPVVAEVGIKEETIGGGTYINPVRLLTPEELVTLTLPDAPFPTTALIVFELTIVKEVAATPPKLTAVVPVKLIPVITTVLPPAAVEGLKDAIAGIGK